MRARGYSLVEVMLAAAVVAIGLTAAAVLVGTLMQQQELNAASLRAANLQEQAVKLYRLDLSPNTIVSLLPESCQQSGTPPPGGYFLSFSRARSTNIEVDGTLVLLDRTGCNMIFASPGGTGALLTNTVTIVRPSLRVEYDQN